MNDPALSAAELDAIEMRACMTYPGVRAAADCFFISRSERDGLIADLRAARGEVESLTRQRDVLKQGILDTVPRASEERDELLGELESLTRQRANRIWPDEGEYQDWLNELMENAGDEFDGDEAMESLAIKYVRALEARVEVLTSALARLEALDAARAAIAKPQPSEETT